MLDLSIVGKTFQNKKEINTYGVEKAPKYTIERLGQRVKVKCKNTDGEFIQSFLKRNIKILIEEKVWVPVS